MSCRLSNTKLNIVLRNISSRKEMNKYIIILYCVLHLLNCVIAEDKKDNEKQSDIDTFIPTHEWQVVRKGQSIPKGLHVRIDFETGITEAKLLDPDDEENNKKKNELLEVSQEKSGEDSNNVYENLKEALKNIPNEDLPTRSPEEIQKIKNNFKSYDELKKEMKDIKMNVKTDAEILHELVKTFTEAESDLVTLKTLEDLEYLVHHIDNANDFIKLDGFNKILYKCLNSSNSDIKCEALNILGSSVQNNPQVQIHAFETGSIDILLKIIALENDSKVHIRALYALSSLLRRFPIAQIKFIKNGGLNVFASVFETAENIKIKLKVINLIHDLLVEQKDAYKNTNVSDYKEKIKQYSLVDLKPKLQMLEWCEIFSKFLFLIDKNDHDTIEKCLNLMLLLDDTCLASFSSTPVRKFLQELNYKYSLLSEEESIENSKGIETDKQNYFSNMKELTDTLIKKLSLQFKTEL